MRTVYHFPENKEFVEETSGQSLISNGYGDYFCLADDFSYQGWYHFRPNPWGLHKSIAAITPLDEGEQHTFHHQLYSFRRSYTSGAHDSIIPYQKSLLYHTQELNGRVLLTLDHRDAYEGSEMGRTYDLIEEEHHVFIKFTKKNEQQKIVFTHWICIKGISALERLETWKEVCYKKDASRGVPATYWVFDACTFIPNAHVVISQGATEVEARTRADVTSYHFQDILSTQQYALHHYLPELPQIPNKQLAAATTSATWSLNQTLQRFSHDHVLLDGFYAGLPWFFQLWSRDELISLGGLIALAQEQVHLKGTIKQILARYVDQLAILNEVPNRFPPTTLESVDALGWFAKRLEQFIDLLSVKKELFTFFTFEELNTWFSHLQTALAFSKHKRGLTFGTVQLFSNEKQETWMDTIYHDTGRPGLRIEIQALYACVYATSIRLAKVLKSEKLRELQKEYKSFISQVRLHFVDESFQGLLLDGITFDGRHDKTYRPNIFLALYLVPSLFSTAVWKTAIKYHLQALFLPWGGLATLDKEHPLYSPSYTGQNNKSYHRGDSWYFVNNLAACALFTLDKARYKETIDRVIHASSTDILQFGFAGHASELSSASVPGGEASPVQTWSAATFLELAFLTHPKEL